jgi:hypothetical protein
MFHVQHDKTNVSSQLGLIAQVVNQNLVILSKAKNHTKYAKKAFFYEKSKKINLM